ncbi:MAG: twin-arginine translocase subunit TatC [Candidatus Limnocylindrales bacterium]
MADADAAREAGAPAPRTIAPDPGLPPPADRVDEPAMSLVDHLTELRNRVFKTVAAILVLSVVGYLRAGAIIDVLRGPIGDRKLVSLSAGGPFFLYIKIALVVGLILGMPVLLYQIWAFVSPGLTPEERRIVRPWVPIALLFFGIGVAVAWVILPFALGFLFSYESASIQITLTIDNYFGFITTLFLAFGLTMQFPIVLYVLSRVGIISSSRLRSARRYVILGIAVFATVVTPGGDLVSPTVLGLTMYLLFEISIIVIRRSGR